MFLVVFGIIYEFVHYALATAFLLSAAISMGLTMRINMHGGPDSSLIPVGVCLAEALIMAIVWSVL